MFILADDESRENEGDLIIPAQHATPAAVNFMAKEGRGLICLAMDGALVDKLKLPLIGDRYARATTAFTLPIEAREGVTTGISAADRAHTIQVAIAESAKPEDISTPGHVFPLRAQDGGVLTRNGHTEAAVDIARLAGLRPAGVICEIMNDDGTMARLPDLIAFARRHGLKLGTVADLVTYRCRTEKTNGG
jgi:3,4-dihydroxy 2-butanone 4-phosphate synthase/GTP cyclohydrolase II